MALIHFQCPQCGFGDHKVGHLIADTDICGVVYFEEQGRQIRVGIHPLHLALSALGSHSAVTGNARYVTIVEPGILSGRCVAV